jgi:Cu2+-exporting ATPase
MEFPQKEQIMKQDEHKNQGKENSGMDHSKMDHTKLVNKDTSMDMVAGHDHHKMMIADFKKRFWVSLIITIPILVFSPMIQGFF